MLSDIIKPFNCAACEFCCKFTEDNLWDVPLFTETQMLLYPNISFKQYEGLWTPLLIKESPFYKCPFYNSDMGCVLKDSKPFDCDLWPFYVMKKDSKIVVSLCNDCSVVNETDFGLLLTILSENRDRILDVCKQYPDYARKYINNYRIIIDI